MRPSNAAGANKRSCMVFRCIRLLRHQGLVRGSSFQQCLDLGSPPVSSQISLQASKGSRQALCPDIGSTEQLIQQLTRCCGQILRPPAEDAASIAQPAQALRANTCTYAAIPTRPLWPARDFRMATLALTIRHTITVQEVSSMLVALHLALVGSTA